MEHCIRNRENIITNIVSLTDTRRRRIIAPSHPNYTAHILIYYTHLDENIIFREIFDYMILIKLIIISAMNKCFKILNNLFNYLLELCEYFGWHYMFYIGTNIM